jgi:hypothetical protein
MKDVYTNSKEISYEDYLKRNETIKDNKLRIIYSSKDNFIKYAKYFGIMNDFKVSFFRSKLCYFLLNNIYISGKCRKNSLQGCSKNLL